MKKLTVLIVLIFSLWGMPAYAYDLQGTITADGTGQGNIPVSLSGQAFRSEISSADGSFVFKDLSSGIYTITPTHSDWAFSPGSSTCTILDKEEYFFGIKTIDESDNQSVLSNVVAMDKMAPSAITDVNVGSSAASTLKLSWTAPGDNGLIGIAASYDIRYSGRFTFIVFHMIPFGQGDIIYRIQPPNPLF